MFVATENNADHVEIVFTEGVKEISKHLTDVNQYLIETGALESGIAVVVDIDPLYEALKESYIIPLLFSVDLLCPVKFSPKNSSLSRVLQGIVSTKRSLAFCSGHVAIIPVVPTKREMDFVVQSALISTDIYITIRKYGAGFSLIFNKARKIQDLNTDPVLSKPFYFK